MLTPPERMSATLRADLRTSPFGLGSCSHMHSAPPENDFSRAFRRNARGGRERIEKRPAKNCGAKSNSHELLRVHTTYLAGEEIKITIPSLENRFFYFFSQPAIEGIFQTTGDSAGLPEKIATDFPRSGRSFPTAVLMFHSALSVLPNLVSERRASLTRIARDLRRKSGRHCCKSSASPSIRSRRHAPPRDPDRSTGRADSGT